MPLPQPLRGDANCHSESECAVCRITHCLSKKYGRLGRFCQIQLFVQSGLRRLRCTENARGSSVHGLVTFWVENLKHGNEA